MDEYNLWFSLVKLPNKVKLQLIKEYKTTEELWKQYKNKGSLIFLNTKVTEAFENAWDEEIFKSSINEIRKNNIGITAYNDEVYPNKLRFLDDAPSILFYKGNLEKINEGHNVAVVGSRKCTNYGIDVTKLITCELCVNNIGIISGLAKGIDSYAHNAAIDNGGYTCAVLGCGIDVIYPKENKALYLKIPPKGCIISEYPPGTLPYAYNFPTRNRVISALSNVILIVEAGYKSGSLITATLALEQGKDVIAVPGSVFSDQSKGTNKLIKDGAYVFTGMEDIFDLLGLKYNAVSTNKSDAILPEQEKIFSIISNNPVHIDDIIRITNIDIKHLYEVLFELQLKNEIMCLAGNYYVRINNAI